MKPLDPDQHSAGTPPGGAGNRPDEGAPGEAAFFELLLDHLCVAGFDGYWKRLNPAWTRTLGWTTEELMARPVIEFVHPDDREATLTARGRLKYGEPLLSLVNRYRHKDGSYRWFEWRSIADPDQELVYAVARDITDEHGVRLALRELTESLAATLAAEKQARQEQERLQRQLMLADRMASVGTLAAGVAHEINNPLTYVTANLEVLREGLRSIGADIPLSRQTEWLEMVAEARQGADRIRKIVRGLRTFSRAEEERRTLLDVKPVLELSVDMAFNEIRHRARLVKDFGHTPQVEADDSRLGQVFINLLVNAAQAVSDGDADANEIRIVTSTDSSGNAVVEIHDTGPGIPANVLDRIFDPFFTTKPIGVGTGLGLAICHTIVSGMGGRITASNREGGGAVFRVTLPAASAPVATPPAPTTPESGSATRRAAVLVVDDERAVGVALGRVLRDHDVTAVTSAKEALALVDSGASFDVVLSDLMMPEMSGMGLYDELIRRRPRLAERMVFITGGAFTAAANAFLDRVPNPRLDKPFEGPTVRAVVESFLK